MSDHLLDGNVLGGPLADVFAFDVTTARGTCDGCGAAASMATLHVYTDAPGVVVRCPGCTAVMVRFAVTGGRLTIDLRGMRLLEIPIPS